MAMMDFLRAGGIGTWVVLLFGLITLVSAAIYAFRPTERRAGFLRGMSQATLFATLAGTTTGFAAVMSKVPSRPQWAHSPDMPLIVMTGLGEALTCAIIGFVMLALCWLMGAVGNRRLVDRLP
jgi:hypothetical protein